MIPKKIHYCWFGGGPKDKLFYKCLNSWKQYFPDWEIIEWNETKFDVDSLEYTEKAYKQKKYAFVSDVARLKIIYDEGGIYFDTDVEVIRKFDEKFLSEGYFGEEEPGSINTGIGFAAPKHNKAIKTMLDSYKDLKELAPVVSQMLDERGMNEYQKLLNEEMSGGGPVFPCPMLNTAALIKAGYDVEIGNRVAGIPVYPTDFFCGFDFRNHCQRVTNNTYSIHHFSASWKDAKVRNKEELWRQIVRIIGPNNYKRLKKVKNSVKRLTQ